jgi:cyanophycinase
MSIHLVGGGWASEYSAAVFGPFLAEATVRGAAAGRDEPRIAIIAVRAPGSENDDAVAHAATLATALGAAGIFEAQVTALGLSDAATLPAIADVDGIIVGGGLTPAYLAALTPIAGEIRRQVSAGVPYLGYSAGAMIAAERALVGGWRLGEVEVSAEGASEGLDELTIQPGIGLLDVSVDVHAAQWGTLSRLIAATEAGLIDGGLAVDENTALIVGEGALRVVGAGSVWRVSQAENGVLVSTFGA